MEATATGLTTGTLGAFTVVHGAAAQIALTGATANLTSGATRVLTATIQDAAGNTVTLRQHDRRRLRQGVRRRHCQRHRQRDRRRAVSRPRRSPAQLAGSVTMEATSAGLTTGTLGAFTVVHGAAADIALTGSTADLTSGATRVLTATIQDAAGNTVSSDNSTVVAFAKASGAGTVTRRGQRDRRRAVSRRRRSPACSPAR